jgi:hypothetical protein
MVRFGEDLGSNIEKGTNQGFSAGQRGGSYSDGSGIIGTFLTSLEVKCCCYNFFCPHLVNVSKGKEIGSKDVKTKQSDQKKSV